MIAHVIQYSLVVSLVLLLTGLCLERVAVLQRLPRRAAWATAMLMSVLLPLAAVGMARPVTTISAAPYAQNRFGTSTPPGSAVASHDVNGVAAKVSAVLQQRLQLPSSWDQSLLVGWAAASATLLSCMAVLQMLLWRRSRAWQPMVVQQQDVLVSESIGPASWGIASPRIVVPRWFLDEAPVVQSLILQHERQHWAARDPLLLWTGMLLVALVPWNLPLWWQLRRLREAIELDCDARMLRDGASADRYGEVLLSVGRRAAASLVGAPAMSGTVPALERRIDSLVPRPVAHGRLKSLSALSLALLGAGVATALDAPVVRRLTVAATVTQFTGTAQAGIAAAAGASALAAAADPVTPRAAARQETAQIRLPPPPPRELDRPRAQAREAMLQTYAAELADASRSGTYNVAIAIRADKSLYQSDLRLSSTEQIQANQVAQRAMLPVTEQSGTDWFPQGTSLGGEPLPNNVLLTWAKLAPGQDGAPLSQAERTARARSAAERATQLALVERHYPDAFTESGRTAGTIWFVLARGGSVVRTGRARSIFNQSFAPDLELGLLTVTSFSKASGNSARVIFAWLAE